jgi:hypothetical protein
MQLVPRYLVNNRINLVFGQHGFITEYRPVYQRTINIYKGIDNPLQFKVINADQKPVSIANYTPMFVAYDSNQNLIIERSGTAMETETTNRGMFTITLSDADTRNVTAQYMKYAVYLVDEQTGSKVVSYANSHFDAAGTIHLKDGVYPTASPPIEETNFFSFKIDDVDYWTTNSIETGPAINAHDSTQTVAVYTTGYTGKIIVQASLDPQISVPVQWATVTEITVTDSQTIVPITFVGVYSFVRVVVDQDPTDKITKILFKI